MTPDERTAALARSKRPGSRPRRTAADGPRIVLGYLRVSTDEQEASGLGLAAQRAAIEAAVERREWTLAGTVEDTTSGATRPEDRPALRDALDDLAHGRANVLMVSRVDRLSRSLRDFMDLLDRSAREGWDVVTLDAHFDTATPMGRMMAQMLGGFAEMERNLIASRVREALEQLRAKGERAGGTVVTSPEVRDRILGLSADGLGPTAIAAVLNADGVPTAKGGREWYASTVRAVLKSIHYEADLATAREARQTA